MRLKYKINYEYDYPTNSMVILLESPYFKEEYPCSNINNLPAVLGSSLIRFNELHQFKIEELQNEETIKEANQKKSNSKKPEGK